MLPMCQPFTSDECTIRIGPQNAIMSCLVHFANLEQSCGEEKMFNQKGIFLCDNYTKTKTDFLEALKAKTFF